MIISLVDAQKLDPEIEQDDLEAFEQSIRGLTNNNFQNKLVRFNDITFTKPNIINVFGEVKGLRIGDTVEVNYTAYNDGLYVVEELTADSIIVEGEPFISSNSTKAMATLVSYPADIKKGVKKLIKYDLDMVGKTGIKTRTVARMSETYYDVNANDNTEGYPSSLLSFLNKYEKMGWG
ncbi:MAG: hypothetical protein ABS862_01620 [Carnobacterium inhibens]|uniref:hypothetical protein n=1 Tax=Carnobacterium sp. TaxID=48221 RepID=UPI0033161636